VSHHRDVGLAVEPMLAGQVPGRPDTVATVPAAQCRDRHLQAHGHRAHGEAWQAGLVFGVCWLAGGDGRRRHGMRALGSATSWPPRCRVHFTSQVSGCAGIDTDRPIGQDRPSRTASGPFDAQMMRFFRRLRCGGIHRRLSIHAATRCDVVGAGSAADAPVPHGQFTPVHRIC